MWPPYCTAKSRSPPAFDALEIQVAEVLLPEVQVAPPSRVTCKRPPASPATITSPAALADIECQIRGLGYATFQLNEVADTVAAMGSIAAVADDALIAAAVADDALISAAAD